MNELYVLFYLIVKVKNCWMFTAKNCANNKCFKEYFIINDERTIN